MSYHNEPLTTVLINSNFEGGKCFLFQGMLHMRVRSAANEPVCKVTVHVFSDQSPLNFNEYCHFHSMTKKSDWSMGKDHWKWVSIKNPCPWLGSPTRNKCSNLFSHTYRFLHHHSSWTTSVPFDLADFPCPDPSPIISMTTAALSRRSKPSR